MIQKTSARHGSTSIAPIRAPATGEPDHWGTWLDHKSSISPVMAVYREVLIPIHGRYYSLEVVQHPVRARMCGFGDKVSKFILTFLRLSYLIIFCAMLRTGDR